MDWYIFEYNEMIYILKIDGRKKQKKKKITLMRSCYSFCYFELNGLWYVFLRSVVLFDVYLSSYIWWPFSFLFSHHFQQHQNERIAIVTSYDRWTAHSLSIFIHLHIVVNHIRYTITFHRASNNDHSIMDYYRSHIPDVNVPSPFR
jgi:hypothetical protein